MNPDINTEQRAPLWTKDFTLLAFGNLLLGIAFYFLVPILPIYLTDILHLPFSEIGVLMALFTISALVIRPFTGFWLDRFDRRTFYLVAFALMVALFALYPMALGLISIALLRLAHGGAWGMTTTASSTIIADIVPARRRGEGIGYFGLSMTLAMSLGPLLGIAIVKHLNYPAMFYSGLGLGLAGFVLVLFVSCPHTTSQKRFKWSELIEPATIPVSFVQLVLNLAYGGLLSYVAMFGKQIGVGNPGNFFLFFAIGMGLSRLWSGKVFDSKGPAMLLRSGFFLLVLGFLILAVSRSNPLFLLSAYMIGTGNGITMPSFQTMINAVVQRERRGAANSTFFAGFDIGIGIGMILFGYLVEKSGFKVSFLICACIAVCSLSLFEIVALRHYTNHLKQSSG
jgi:predicted MFS family arabinose efflux permease